MGSDVKRAYDGRRRAARSEATRERVLAAARTTFLDEGYGATTVAAVARVAGVHVDTVYALVGTKSELIGELVERALSGVDRAVPAAERAYVAEIRAATDQRRKLEIYAAATRAMLERVAPLFVVLRDAAGTDAGARDLWRAFADRRARNMRQFVADVAAAGGLRPGLSIDEAADVVWATNSPELFVMLTDERGWPADRYEQWLADAWARLLLPG
jgi:AcrR family transcriptional regulator